MTNVDEGMNTPKQDLNLALAFVEFGQDNNGMRIRLSLCS